MAPPLFLHEYREPGAWGVMADRKIYHLPHLFVKRTLRRHEWIDLPRGGVVQPTAAMPQRYRTDAAIQRYLREHTNIPLPSFVQTFEDDGAVYLTMEFMSGAVQMDELPEADRKVVEKELRVHLETLKNLRSDTPGVPGEEFLVGPVRVCDYHWHYHTCWRPRPEAFAAPKGREDGESGGDQFVLCHNDLGQHNVLVDPETLKIKAIIDWEFAGFWPPWFEQPFFERQGGGIPLEGEEDNTERCREWLLANCEPVEMEHLLTLQEKIDTYPPIPIPKGSILLKKEEGEEEEEKENEKEKKEDGTEKGDEGKEAGKEEGKKKEEDELEIKATTKGVAAVNIAEEGTSAATLEGQK